MINLKQSAQKANLTAKSRQIYPKLHSSAWLNDVLFKFLLGVFAHDVKHFAAFDLRIVLKYRAHFVHARVKVTHEHDADVFAKKRAISA